LVSEEGRDGPPSSTTSASSSPLPSSPDPSAPDDYVIVSPPEAITSSSGEFSSPDHPEPEYSS